MPAIRAHKDGSKYPLERHQAKSRVARITKESTTQNEPVISREADEKIEASAKEYFINEIFQTIECMMDFEDYILNYEFMGKSELEGDDRTYAADYGIREGIGYNTFLADLKTEGLENALYEATEEGYAKAYENVVKRLGKTFLEIAEKEGFKLGPETYTEFGLTTSKFWISNESKEIVLRKMGIL